MPRLGDWFEKRAGLRTWKENKKNLLIPDHVNFFYCFGGISLVIILIQVVTGFFLLFFYEPKAELAFQSILKISNEVPYGWFGRNMHRWGATLLIATVVTHMCSVFYFKAFRNPRELNWLSGLVMFIMVWLFLITGQILPWDWRGYWVFVILVDYIGTWPLVGKFLIGPILNTFTVTRSYAVHVWLLPLVTIIILFFHFKMIKRHGISGPL
ncbi:MAG: cytochrome b N-terminal domain-containing protein [Deltaproteobacteria bacterium]|nr:cytochrome b N-terminal domain-containing protein [Deltaproteobacteria bacterium]